MRKMGKSIAIILLGVMVLGVTACFGGKPFASSEAKVEGTLVEIMEKIYDGANLELPEMVIQEINEESAEYFLGVNDINFDQAIASEPMMSSQAHSVVLLRTSEGEDIEAIKSKIKENIDGRKWICVEVEEKNIITDSIGDLVILIMDENSKAIQDSFLSLAE